MLSRDCQYLLIFCCQNDAMLMSSFQNITTISKSNNSSNSSSRASPQRLEEQKAFPRLRRTNDRDLVCRNDRFPVFSLSLPPILGGSCYRLACGCGQALRKQFRKTESKSAGPAAHSNIRFPLPVRGCLQAVLGKTKWPPCVVHVQRVHEGCQLCGKNCQLSPLLPTSLTFHFF